MESETLTAGDSLTTFDTPWGKMGLCICYDIRFPEWMRLMALEGAKAVFIPAAFNMTTALPTGNCLSGHGRWITRFISLAAPPQGTWRHPIIPGDTLSLQTLGAKSWHN